MILPIDKNHQINKDSNQPLFEAGQLVRHRRYNYRGVIVERDLTYRGTEQWYQKNNTQPHREQPWYHVLVDGAMLETYAAHSSLGADVQATEVEHPLVEVFFSGLINGRYVRNDRPWG